MSPAFDIDGDEYWEGAGAGFDDWDLFQAGGMIFF